MDSLIVTHAPADEVFARGLAEFVESNLPIQVSCTESVVGPELDPIEATERALSAEAALVLLSSHSVPKVWSWPAWEPVFIEKPKEFQTHLAFVQLADCAFPDLLRRQRFFDAARDTLAAMREIKRWLLRPMQKPGAPAQIAAEFDELRRAIADRPGAVEDIAAEAAIRFTGACYQDFEGIYRFDLGGRTRAGILGDIGSALGLTMSGALEQNREALAEWCAARRALFLFANVRPEDRDFATFAGRASTIFTGAMPETIPSATAGMVREFQRTRDTVDGWKAVNLLKAQERHAEVLEVLDAMSRATRDAVTLQFVAREQFWLRGCDGNLAVGRIPAENDQLTLPFG